MGLPGRENKYEEESRVEEEDTRGQPHSQPLCQPWRKKGRKAYRIKKGNKPRGKMQKKRNGIIYIRKPG